LVIGRGGIYWVDFHGATGAEIRKARPAVVISTTDHNEHMRTVTVVPISSRAGPVFIHEVAVPAGVIGDGRPGRLKPHQVRAVDKSRLGRPIGRLPARLLFELEASLLQHLGIALV
jgi:mRNA interferase MazF